MYPAKNMTASEMTIYRIIIPQRPYSVFRVVLFQDNFPISFSSIIFHIV